MNLATRCPQCQTVFRVVQDQLRVSEGWVRCGRCSDVFNAAEHLVDPSTGQARHSPIAVHSGLPQPVTPSPAAPSQHSLADGPDAGVADGAALAAAELHRLHAQHWAEGAAQGQAEIGATVQANGRLDDRSGPAADPLAHGPGDAGAAAMAAAGPAEAGAASDDSYAGRLELQAGALPDASALALRGGPAAAPAGAAPSFVRRAERAARWQRPGVRALLGLGVLAAALALATQSIYVLRDHAAARWPELQPLLASACASLGCRIEALRAIDALVVENSGLVRVEKSELYKLSIALRNRRGYEVALPAIDLSLTDTQGRLIARRVLRASELGAGGATLAGGAELALQASIQVAAAPVTGYTIDLFYP